MNEKDALILNLQTKLESEITVNNDSQSKISSLQALISDYESKIECLKQEVIAS